jgi:hypothetical protein
MRTAIYNKIRFLIALAMIGLAGHALASDGQLEINQACAVNTGCFTGDTPGFPVTITQSGSYRLTGNLDLTAENPATNGIDVSAPATTVDLGGFQIVGPTTCSGACGAVSCAPSSGSSGWAVVFQSGAIASTVRNGTVRNMGNTGIGSAANNIHIEGIKAYHNAFDGIGTNQNTVVLNSIVFENGQDGIDVDAGSLIDNSSSACNKNHGIEVDGLNGIVVRSTAQGNGADGINITVGGAVIENVTASGNLGDGIEANGVGSLVKGSVARGNGADGIKINSGGSVIENVTTSGNASDGISGYGDANLVRGSTSRGNNGKGFNLNASDYSKYRDNVSTGNGSFDDCGQGICTSQRRFYLTLSGVSGASALNRCGAGFHMASLYEIMDPTQLRYSYFYDSTTGDDSGLGPPSDNIFGAYGWIRTGARSSGGNTGPGLSNCESWTTNDATKYGTIVQLRKSWNSTPNQYISPWEAFTNSCDKFQKVWCVEDD